MKDLQGVPVLTGVLTSSMFNMSSEHQCLGDDRNLFTVCREEITEAGLCSLEHTVAKKNCNGKRKHVFLIGQVQIVLPSHFRQFHAY